MNESFDDFESAMKRELELAIPTFFNALAVERGLKPVEGNGYSASLEEVPNIVTAVVLDATLLMLRRYHEWTEAAPR